MSIARRNPNFARLLAALATSQLGDWLYNLALLAYVQERTHSATWLGLTTGARLAPMVLGAPLGGLIADRADRRALLIGSDILRAGLMGALVGVALIALPVILVPVLAACATLAGVAYPSTVASLTRAWIEPDQLAGANAARGVIAPACIAAGPALGAVLLLLGSPLLVFALNAGTFLLSGLIVTSIGSREAFGRTACAAGDPGSPSVAAVLRSTFTDLRAGVATLRSAPEAPWLVCADSAASFVYGAQTVLLILVAGRLGLGVNGYGYLLAAQGAGGILGARLAGRLNVVAERRATLAAALLLVAAPLPVLAFTTSVPGAILVSLVAGVGALLVEVVADTRLQRTLEEDRLGCAYGFVLTSSIGAIAVGGLVTPGLIALSGAAGALCLIAGGVLLLALVLVAPSLRRGGLLARPAVPSA